MVYAYNLNGVFGGAIANQISWPALNFSLVLNSFFFFGAELCIELGVLLEWEVKVIYMASNRGATFIVQSVNNLSLSCNHPRWFESCFLVVKEVPLYVH